METLMLSQVEYIKFNMQNAKPVNMPLGVHFKLSKEQSPKTEEECGHMKKVTYASAIGSSIYVMVCMRPDIMQAVGVVSMYMNNPSKMHQEAVKWILKYLRSTKRMTLCFRSGDMRLEGFVDVDTVGDVDNRKSITRYVYTLGGIAVSQVS